MNDNHHNNKQCECMLFFSLFLFSFLFSFSQLTILKISSCWIGKASQIITFSLSSNTRAMSSYHYSGANERGPSPKARSTTRDSTQGLPPWYLPLVIVLGLLHMQAYPGRRPPKTSHPPVPYPSHLHVGIQLLCIAMHNHHHNSSS